MVETERNPEEIQAARMMATPESLIANLSIVTVPLLLHGEAVPYVPTENPEGYTYYAKFRGGHSSVDNPDRAIAQLQSKAGRVVTAPPLQRVFDNQFQTFMDRQSWSVAWEYAETAQEQHPRLETISHLVEAGSRTVHEWCRVGLFVLNGLGLPEDRFFGFKDLIKLQAAAKKLSDYDPEEAAAKQVLITQMMYQDGLKHASGSTYEVSHYWRPREIVGTDHLTDEHVALIKHTYDLEGLGALEASEGLFRINHMLGFLSIGGLVTAEEIQHWLDGIADDVPIDFFEKKPSPFHSDLQFADPGWDLPYLLGEWRNNQSQMQRLAVRLQQVRATQLASLIQDPGQLPAHETYNRKLVLANDGLRISVRGDEGELTPAPNDTLSDFLEPLLRVLEDGEIGRISSTEFSEYMFPNFLGAISSGVITNEQAQDVLARIFISINEGAAKYGLRRAVKVTRYVLSNIDDYEWQNEAFWSVIDERVIIGHLQELVDTPARIREVGFEDLEDLYDENDYYREEAKKMLESFKLAPRGWYKKYYRPWEDEQQRLHDIEIERLDRWIERKERKDRKTKK